MCIIYTQSSGICKSLISINKYIIMMMSTMRREEVAKVRLKLNKKNAFIYLVINCFIF